MTSASQPGESNSLIEQVRQAGRQGKLSAGAVDNISAWLSEPRYAEYASQVAEHIERGLWKELDDAFWTIIPFGTGGRRGRMYPIGSNAINDRTIGESAQGLADYVKEQFPGRELRCAIAYDTRHRSRHFAELCAEVMTGNGYKVSFLDGYRSTPELSFAVRQQRCVCGIMVTASHNPPSDNAVKAYWASGGQLLPPHDQGVIDRVMSAGDIRRQSFQQGLESGQIVYCQQEVDAAFLEAIKAQRRSGPRSLKIIYSPLHGVGASAVMPALAADGFVDVELFGPHAEPNGDFPNVPGHVSNPENPAVFDLMIERARQSGADLILATDPDCDRVGCAVRINNDPGAPWTTLTGNQIGALLTEYLCEKGKAAGSLRPDQYVVKTLVTTELIRRVADRYGVATEGDLLVGFKWIGGVIDERGPEGFILGAEESYGFLVGSHARDKDAAVSAMLLAELAAEAKAQGQTLQGRLDGLFRRYGCHAERTVSVSMPGSAGMERMKEVMAAFREAPPASLAGSRVCRVRDYFSNMLILPGESPAAGSVRMPLAGPRGDLIMLDLEAEGNYVAVRPSGTEPKVKFYMFAYQPPDKAAALEADKAALEARLTTMEGELRQFAGVA